MSLPEPVPGLVIRHGFIWSHDVAEGRVTASKARPCAIIVAAVAGEDGEIRVTVAPITHAPPTDQSIGGEIPRQIANKLGLDAGEHWIRYDELNHFTWPGFDLERVPGRQEYFYGQLPDNFFITVRNKIVATMRAKRVKGFVNRD
ncbi:hypothetical protein [Hyphococcus sp.]|uniref:hypothetical protein n=1 Tax=Hyphococcus sp. TaxID=2038636 RepID=UPI0035C772F8